MWGPPPFGDEYEAQRTPLKDKEPFGMSPVFSRLCLSLDLFLRQLGILRYIVDDIFLGKVFRHTQKGYSLVEKVIFYRK